MKGKTLCFQWAINEPYVCAKECLFVLLPQLCAWLQKRMEYKHAFLNQWPPEDLLERTSLFHLFSSLWQHFGLNYWWWSQLLKERRAKLMECLHWDAHSSSNIILPIFIERMIMLNLQSCCQTHDTTQSNFPWHSFTWVLGESNIRVTTWCRQYNGVMKELLACEESPFPLQINCML